MKNETPAGGSARVLIVGRSPSVLRAAVDLLRGKGYLADVTNQFDRVLDEYDVSDLDVLVFGGMIPPETKQYLREEITKRNAGVTVVQGLAGIPGVIAAQVEAVTGGGASSDADIAYNPEDRTVRLTLPGPEQVTIEALWMTSWTPPEPTSTSAKVYAGDLAAGSHEIALPDEVPSEGSFAAVTVGAQVTVLTVGPLPTAVRRMVPKSASDRRLPDVAAVTTHTSDA
jgi:hypothetical protein